MAALGTTLRWMPTAKFRRAGFDEVLYASYIRSIEGVGLMNYDAIATHYIERQRDPAIKTELPPTRFLYIFTGWLWKRAQFGDAPALNLNEPGSYDRDPYYLSLRHVSALFSTLLMLCSGLAAWRWRGPWFGVGVMALMACAPLQIHTSQHAMIDSFFAFWAGLTLWLVWENLQAPRHAGWLTALGLSLLCMVLTKENAFFVYFALSGLLLLSRWTGFGKLTPTLAAVFVIAPLLGLVILVNLAGGPSNFIETYRLLVTKAQHLDYAIITGDGPWYRYLVDMLVMSPLILLLTVAAAFNLPREDRVCHYLLGFIALSYLVMCNVRYGMNLRYTTIWDFPMRVLVVTALPALATRWCAPARYFVPVAIAALCAYDVYEYWLFFVNHPLYELVPDEMLEVVRILKSAA